MVLEKMEEFDHNKVIEQFEAISRDAGRVQRETLKKILEENGEAEYLQKWGLKGRTDPESFKACVPLVTHKDVEPYIRRIADGEVSPIITGKPIASLSLSSGTTQGKQKFLPFNEELMENTMEIYRTSFAYRNREFPIKNGRALQFIYASKEFKTNGGLTASTATAKIYHSEKFKATMKDIQSQCCSPDEVIFSPDFSQSLYCHLLCGLIYSKQVQFVSSTFAHSIVHAFRTFEQLWEDLYVDIREGVLSSRITVPSIRSAVSKLLEPNPELAADIYEKCSKLKDWCGLIPTLWPNAKYVCGIMTGSMEPYLNKLRHYAGKLPLVSPEYGASEGWIGSNVNPRLPPESTVYAVLPDIGYFEFIPLQEKLENGELENTINTLLYKESDPVSLTEVKIGEQYEIVITNFAGLYRYRLGDVVKVMSFHNSTPELQFVCRRNLVLNINIDKNTEKDLQLAIEEAIKLLAGEKLELIDFTSHVDMSTDPGHYVVFWELSGEGSEEVLKSCCNCLDQSFVDAGYVGSRKTNAIGPLELRIVSRGTYHKILLHYLGLGAAVSQFKVPRCVGSANQAVLHMLSNNVVESYFSTAFG